MYNNSWKRDLASKEQWLVNVTQTVMLIILNLTPDILFAE